MQTANILLFSAVLSLDYVLQKASARLTGGSVLCPWARHGTGSTQKIKIADSSQTQKMGSKKMGSFVHFSKTKL